MNTRLILTGSAILLGLQGLALNFIPAEIAGFLFPGAPTGLTLVLQLLGAGYLAMAMLNWMARGSLLGGIYNRPVAMASFTFYFIGALSLGKALPTPGPWPVVWYGLFGFYAGLALIFARLLFRHPLPEKQV